MELRAVDGFDRTERLHALQSLTLKANRLLVMCLRDGTDRPLTLEFALCRALYRVDLGCAFFLDGNIDVALRADDVGCWMLEVFNSKVQEMFEADGGDIVNVAVALLSSGSG